MNNKESQSNNTDQTKDTAQEERYTYDVENGQDKLSQEDAAIEAELQQDADQADASKSHEVVSAQPVGTTAGAGGAGSTEGNGRSNPVWIVVSAVLAFALFVVLVIPRGDSPSNGSVATVNGTDITKNQLFDAMVDYVGAAALDNLILEELVQQEATAASVTVTEEDIDFEVETIKGYYGSDEEFEAALAQNKLTVEGLREDMRLNVMIRKILEPRTNVTDESIQQYYDENKYSLSDTPIEIQASHILVATKEEADAIVAELKQGADFAELAKEKSTDSSAANGGDLGFFTYEGMIPEFSKAAFALEVGQVSDAVQSQYGFHVIKKTDAKEGTLPTLEEKKDEIRTILVGLETQTLSGPWIEEIRAKAKITNTLVKEEPTDETVTDAAAE